MDPVPTKRKRHSNAKDCKLTPEDLKFASFFAVVEPSMEARNPDPSLEIPTVFINRFRAYLSNHLKLQAPTGHIWDVYLDSDNHSQFRITTGWKEFACNLQIQSGDLMIFDLISAGHFKVYIYEGEDSCEKNILLNQNRSTQDLELQKNAQSRVPESDIPVHVSLEDHNITACDQKYNMTSVVDDLANDNGFFSVASKSDILMDVNVKQHSKTDESQKHNKSVTSKSNILMAGNVKPQLKTDLNQKQNKSVASKSNIFMNVTVKKHYKTDQNNCFADRDLIQCTEKKVRIPMIPYYGFSLGTKYITREDLLNILEQFHNQTQESFKVAMAYTSTNPFTVLVMNRSNVCHGFKLGFPRSFGRQYISKNATDVYLMDKDKRFWTVNWLGDSNEYCFSAGWKHFAVDHDLQCGDICVFELVNTKKKVKSFLVNILKVCPSDAELIKEYIPSKLSLVLERK